MHGSKTKSNGKTYADLMAVPTPASQQDKAAPFSSPQPPRAVIQPLKSQHAPQQHLESAISTIGSYANMMAPLPVAPANTLPESSLPTPPLTPLHEPIPLPTMELLSKDDDEPPFPRSDVAHLTKSPIPSLELPSADSSEESVLFAPAEKMCRGTFGRWKDLKGDPKKLERLNGPAKFKLESRWAC